MIFGSEILTGPASCLPTAEAELHVIIGIEYFFEVAIERFERPSRVFSRNPVA